ncbi:MAG: hypothetical protein Q8935_21795 [Bacillota bacterium]|nr:hypothetical protein [Bacillota bacterium]
MGSAPDAVQDRGQAAAQYVDQVEGRDVAAAHQAAVQVGVQGTAQAAVRGTAQAVAQAAVRAVIHVSLLYLDHIEAVQAVTQGEVRVNILEAVQAVVQEDVPAIQEVVQVIVQAAVSDAVPAAVRVWGQVVGPADVNKRIAELFNRTKKRDLFPLFNFNSICL